MAHCGPHFGPCFGQPNTPLEPFLTPWAATLNAESKLMSSYQYIWPDPTLCSSHRYPHPQCPFPHTSLRLPSKLENP